uniref:Uncharacterized protein n=1 Tax=Ditylenchus dipsaci TaxID=166011 RepID=A0A915DF00_9BILA
MRELENLPKKHYPSPEEAFKALNADCLREENERKEIELKAFLKTQMQSSFEVKRLHEKFLREKVVKNETHHAEKIAVTPVKKAANKRPLNPVPNTMNQKQYAQYALYHQQFAQYSNHDMSFALPRSPALQLHQSNAQPSRVPQTAPVSQIAQNYQFMLNNPAAMAAFYNQMPSQITPYLQIQKSLESSQSNCPSTAVMANNPGTQQNHWHDYLNQHRNPVKSEHYASCTSHTNLLQQASINNISSFKWTSRLSSILTGPTRIMEEGMLMPRTTTSTALCITPSRWFRDSALNTK